MRRKCDMPFRMLKIQMDGSIFMCSSGQPARINAFEADPLQIWNSDAFKILRYQLDNEQYDPMCLSCPLVQDSGGAVESGPPSVEDLKFRLSGDLLLDPERRPLQPAGNLTGWVDILEQSTNMLTVGGWSANPTSRSIPKTVVIFINGVAVGAGKAFRPRQDVSSLYNAMEVLMCGFQVNVPLKGKKMRRGSRVRVFAIDHENHVSELRSASNHPLMQSPYRRAARKFFGRLAGSAKRWLSAASVASR